METDAHLKPTGIEPFGSSVGSLWQDEGAAKVDGESEEPADQCAAASQDPLRLYLPETFERVTEIPAAFRPRALPPRRILIVDDEVALSNAYKRLFEPRHAVVIAESALHALELLARNADFDLVLCDLMMPRLDGPAFFEILKERHPHLAPKTVFSTGALTNKQARPHADTQNLCVAKPVRPSELRRLFVRLEGDECNSTSDC